MPPKLNFAHAHQFDTIALLTTRSSQIDFELSHDLQWRARVDSQEALQGGEDEDSATGKDPGKPEDSGKYEDSGKSEDSGKYEGSGKSEDSGKHEPPGKYTDSKKHEDLQDNFRLIVEAHAPGVFRLRGGVPARLALAGQQPSSRYKARFSLSTLLLAREEAIGEVTVEPCSDGRGWRLTQGEITLEILTHPVRFALFRGETQVLATHATSHAPALGYGLSDHTLIHSSPQNTSKQARWTLNFALASPEPLYGLGETEGDLNRRNTVIVSDDPADRALPLAWSPTGWGVYVNSAQRVRHALGAAPADDSYLITIEDELLDLFIFVGDPAEILNQYTALTGRFAQPPLWAMGVWMRQPAGEKAEQTFPHVEKFQVNQLPLDVITLGPPALWSFHADKLQLEWDNSRLPDARQLFAAFHQCHIHVCAPGFPGVLGNSPLFEDLADRGWLLTNQDGQAQLFEGSQASGAQPYGLLDLTQHEVYTRWVEQQRQLIEEGLDIPACDIQIALLDTVSARSGESGARLRTFYPLLARRALYEAAVGDKVPPEGVVLSTDLSPAAQRFPWQGGRRTCNDWQGLERSLRSTLSVGASGLPVQLQAIGNAEASLTSMTETLYLRWLTLGVFSANLSFEGLDALLPWAFGAEVLTQIRSWLAWRYRLIPYVMGVIEDAARTGLPVQRNMAMSFPHDATAHKWQLQYLLGPALLVAPMITPGDTLEVYLPKDEAWWDLNTGYRYEGGSTWTVQCGLGQYPVFGREGHMLCLGPSAQHTSELNSARLLEEVWMFGMPVHNPVVMRNKIRVMQMQGSSYIKGLEGLRIFPSEGLEVKRRGAEVRISRAR